MVRLGVLVLLVFAATASADYAPVNAPGPRLTIPRDRLAQSLRCTDSVRHATREPVLLVPATEVDSEENFGWNYIRAFDTLGIPYCTTDVPGPARQNTEDMQTRAEYLVYAIRRMHRLAGRRIAIVGHSQGGMIMRWPLRFWPDLRPDVEDVVGMAGTNHGSAIVDATICAVPCAPALQQQKAASDWTAALNSGQETFAGIDYTEIYSHVDEFVQPAADDTGTSSVHGPGRITNVALQDICPADVSEHLKIGTEDPAAYALVMDAINHDGPADPARISSDVCSQAFQPGVDPATEAANFAAASERVAIGLSTSPTGPEPPLRCYTQAATVALPLHTRSVRVNGRRVPFGRGPLVVGGGARVRIIRAGHHRPIVRTAPCP